jgi:hypothetical protein
MRTNRGAPTGISFSNSFQHPFNRAGGRTFNVDMAEDMSIGYNGFVLSFLMGVNWGTTE